MFSKNRKLVALIVGITVVPLSVLLFIGWRLLQQDRILQRQQVQQSVERAADLVVSAIDRAISESQRRLMAGNTEWPARAVAVTLRDDRIETYPKGRVAYVPAATPLHEARSEVFASAELLEFAKRDTAGAIDAFRLLSQSADPAIKAGAYLRLGRNLAVARRTNEAFDTYGKVAAMDDVGINSVPAALVGRYARCELLAREQRLSELREEAKLLLTDLDSGRWSLLAPVYFLYSADAIRWSASTRSGKTPAEIFSETLETLWKRRQSLAQSGRELFASQNVVVLWQHSGDVVHALIAAPEFVQSAWMAPAGAVAAEQRVFFQIVDTQLRLAAPFATRNPQDTNLPWRIVIRSSDPAGESANFVLRRRLMIAGFALLVVMASIAAYVIVRAVNRELAVARLQSDFVAAVSHEFRTPLTTLRQFTEILRKNESDSSDQGQERRLLCYDAQGRATDRLTRLVESLLEFGRVEAGARRYEFSDQDCSELVQRVVDDFRHEARAVGYEVMFQRNGSISVHVDFDALALVLRNLLDNAVKYSPDHHSIEVSLARSKDDIRIAVRDHGIGIPPNERLTIFSKFQRGEQARTRGIKGTGIGLAMVDEILKAHRGRVEVTSEVGKGSTFTIVLPQ